MRLVEHLRRHADMRGCADLQLPDLRGFGDLLRRDDLPGWNHVRSESGLPLHPDVSGLRLVSGNTDLLGSADLHRLADVPRLRDLFGPRDVRCDCDLHRNDHVRN